jgi:hypothetical protein
MLISTKRLRVFGLTFKVLLLLKNQTKRYCFPHVLLENLFFCSVILKFGDFSNLTFEIFKTRQFFKFQFQNLVIFQISNSKFSKFLNFKFKFGYFLNLKSNKISISKFIYFQI